MTAEGDVSPKGRRTDLLTAWPTPEDTDLVRRAAAADDVSVSHLMRNDAVRDAREGLSETCPHCGGGPRMQT